ncbi:helix-turn-helix domain-containing protein, partial
MTRPYSNDLRERVVAAVVDGQSCRVVAERFDIAVSSVVKWSQRYRTTGSVSPGKMGGHRRRVLEPHRAFIVEQIEQTSHLTLHRLKDELAARGVSVSHNAIWQFMRREGLSFKTYGPPGPQEFLFAWQLTSLHQRIRHTAEPLPRWRAARPKPH